MEKHKEEMEAVRTTIVGGRPPGCGRRDVGVPRGIEVLVKKASVDEGFKAKLLAQRAAAAGEIGLELDPAEAAMLGVIAEEQLAGIIKQTVVPTEQRRVFMGTVAAAMLAVLGVGLASCGKSDATGTGAGSGAASQTAPASTEPMQRSAGFQVRTLPGTSTATSPQTAPGPNEVEVIKGLRMDVPPAASTQAAPETGAVVVFGARVEPPPATSTQTGPATETTPGAAGSAPAAINEPGAIMHNLERTRPVGARMMGGAMAGSPLTSTRPATATSTAPATTSSQPAATEAKPAATATNPEPVFIGGMMADRPPEARAQPAPATGTEPGTAPTSAPLIIRGLRADVPPATRTEPASAAAPTTNAQPAPAATETQPAETKPAATAPATTRRGYGGVPGGMGGGMGPARN